MRYSAHQEVDPIKHNDLLGTGKRFEGKPFSRAGSLSRKAGVSSLLARVPPCAP